MQRQRPQPADVMSRQKFWQYCTTMLTFLSIAVVIGIALVPGLANAQEQIAAPNGRITDTNGDTWSWGPQQPNQHNLYAVYRNGSPPNGQVYVASTMQIVNGALWANSPEGWFYWNGSSYTIAGASGPRTTTTASAGSTGAEASTGAKESTGAEQSTGAKESVGAKAVTGATPSTESQKSAGSIQGGCVKFTGPAPAPQLAANALGDEFVGPFASWSNLKAKYGAIGDGKHDDTKAIQNALDDLRTAAGNSPNLYIPSGTYLVTQTLTVASARGIGVLGEDPTNTTLKWAGASGGTLFHINAVSYSRFDRLTFDGGGVASVVLIDQSAVPGTSGGQFDTGNEYADDVFQNGFMGIQGGQNGIGAAESSVLRSKFIRNTYGIALRNFNALDWWVWYSEFDNNETGITNYPINLGGAGNFHVFNSVFNSSSHADIVLLNTGNFNFRDNFSINSSQFVDELWYYTNAAVTRLQGNTVITNVPNGCGGCSIYQGNEGPTILTDNTFVSPAGATLPAVIIMGQDPADCISIGNTYTHSDPVQCGGYPLPWRQATSGRLISQDDRIVSASSVRPTTPSLPGVLANYNRQIFDLAPGASSATIQRAVQQAAALCGQRPIIHLPYGTYHLTSTITVPANCNIQLVGDGMQTVLMWNGPNSGSAIVLEGPSKAILREFYLNAERGTGIDVQKSDQPGSRIYMEETSALRSLSENIFVDSLDYTLVELHDFQIANTSVAPASTGVGIKVVGGPLAQQGNPQYGRTNLLAGSGGANYLSYQVSQGGTLLVRDSWYEANFASNYAQISDNSSLTIEGSRIANSGGSGGLAIPTSAAAVEVRNLSCNAAILSSAPDSAIKLSGVLTGDLWVAGNNFGTASDYFANQSSGEGSAAFNLNRYSVVGYGSKPVADLTPVPTAKFIRTTLAQSRYVQPTQILDLAPGLTDVRFYRITVELGNIGIHLQN
jgi:hypothetical protein